MTSCGANLFRSSDLSAWTLARSNYACAIERLALSKYSKSKDPDSDRKEFVALDTWVTSPDGNVNCFNGPLTREKLSKVVKWKLSKGSFRPGLQQKVDSNPDAEISEAWRKAAACIVRREDNLVRRKNDSDVLSPESLCVMDAIKELDKHLCGVGPATASALLAPIIPDIAAFMSDEALLACGLFANTRTIKYDIKNYGRFNERMLAKARELNAKQKVSDEFCWSPEDVQRALFAVETLDRHKIGVEQMNSSSVSGRSRPLLLGRWGWSESEVVARFGLSAVCAREVEKTPCITTKEKKRLASESLAVV